MFEKVRVRFAPSPTGGLHLGGVRTVLFNYLFARQHGGDFILRIEDTDQTRYVPGAEEYIYDCLRWCGLEPDESPQRGGAYGPYRQSERKNLYRAYAEKLVEAGHAYYAFDTPEELDAMREKLRASGSSSLQYDYRIRQQMRNSLHLTANETQALLEAGTPYVIRIKVNPNEFVSFTDLIRGDLQFDTNQIDDKVLLKADGMPTYHLAVVVDDYLMEISHAFRGEEWLPSAPVHVLLWKHLFGLDRMPQWAHLPLILKPDGNGKLSKRDGDRLGFPVYAMDWTDPNTQETTRGFREIGFLPEAFLNMLALLGWNDGTEQELFTLDELTEKFSLERVHKGGAKFDFEKAKHFNHSWIQRTSADALLPEVSSFLQSKGIANPDPTFLIKVMELIKERCTLLPDFYEQGHYFFQAPIQRDWAAILPKWDQARRQFFTQLVIDWEQISPFDAQTLETYLKEKAPEHGLKAGDVQLPLRLMLVGGKMGPAVVQIAEMIGRKDTRERIQSALAELPA